MANPVWCVASVEPREDYSMLITFENGEKRLYDTRPLLSKPICSDLKNVCFFMKAKRCMAPLYGMMMSILRRNICTNAAPRSSTERMPEACRRRL